MTVKDSLNNSTVADHYTTVISDRPTQADFSVLSESAKRHTRQDKMLKSVAKWENLIRGTNPISRNRRSTVSPTFASSFSLAHSTTGNNKVTFQNQSHSREAANRDFVRSRRVLLKDTPYNEEGITPRKEKKTNSNDSREVHMIFG